jgi:hypothetical protein
MTCVVLMNRIQMLQNKEVRKRNIANVIERYSHRVTLIFIH